MGIDANISPLNIHTQHNATIASFPCNSAPLTTTISNMLSTVKIFNNFTRWWFRQLGAFSDYAATIIIRIAPYDRAWGQPEANFNVIGGDNADVNKLSAVRRMTLRIRLAYSPISAHARMAGGSTVNSWVVGNTTLQSAQLMSVPDVFLATMNSGQYGPGQTTPNCDLPDVNSILYMLGHPTQFINLTSSIASVVGAGDSSFFCYLDTQVAIDFNSETYIIIQPKRSTASPWRFDLGGNGIVVNGALARLNFSFDAYGDSLISSAGSYTPAIRVSTISRESMITMPGSVSVMSQSFIVPFSTSIPWLANAFAYPETKICDVPAEVGVGSRTFRPVSTVFSGIDPANAVAQQTTWANLNNTISGLRVADF